MSSILQAFPLTVGTWTIPGPGWMLGIILPAPFWWLFLCPWLSIFISMRLVLSWRLEGHLPQTHKASAAGSSLASSLLPCKSQRRWPPQMHNSVFPVQGDLECLFGLPLPMGPGSWLYVVNWMIKGFILCPFSWGSLSCVVYCPISILYIL